MSVEYVAHVDARGNEYTEYTRLDMDEQDYEFDPEDMVWVKEIKTSKRSIARRDLADRPGYGGPVKKGDTFAHRIYHVISDEDGSSTFRHYKWNYGKKPLTPSNR